MALKKSDLYSSLWNSADELRGSMDASQYKDYVLTLLFIKYVSDKFKSDPHSLIHVPVDGSFDHLISLKGKPNVGEGVNIAVRRLAEENGLQGVINNADFDDPTKLGSGKDLQDRVSNLIGIFQDIDFTASSAEGDDLLGDAYEYLMRHFATQSGKSKGQFYTPAEVSRVMAHLLQIPADAPKSTTVYDPTCGSGSLLIKVADSASNGLTIYGQEKDNATWALARMNMILHGNETHEIAQGNTFAAPGFTESGELKKFDYLVANPPFSVKTWRNGLENDYGMFDGFTSPPEKNGDFAFLLHMIKSLKSTGRAAVILPRGILFRGNAEAHIRRELVQRGYIKAIVGLPNNLFYGTGIPACIVLIDKQDAENRSGIFMIDSSRGFEKDGPKNRLRPRDVHKIVDTFINQTETLRFSRFVKNDEISNPKNDFNLNISRYIDSSEPEDIQDLNGHIAGGIPHRDLDSLALYWQAFPGLREILFKPLRSGFSELACSKSEIEGLVLGFKECSKLRIATIKLVKTWWEGSTGSLTTINSATRASELASELGEKLLAAFRAHPLLDEYAIFEQFMSYWNTSMSDDVTLIASQGWTLAAQPRSARTWKDKNNKTKFEPSHLSFGSGASSKRWVTDLIPPGFLVSRYFSTAQLELEELNLDLQKATQTTAEFLEEHTVEEGLLWEATEDDKVTTASVKNRLRAVKAENGDLDEITALETVTGLFARETEIKKKVKDASTKLQEMVFQKYAELSEDEIRQLVIEDKWSTSLETGIESEIESTIQSLIVRLQTLASRYESTVSSLEKQLDVISAKVNNHLSLMGFQK